MRPDHAPLIESRDISVEQCRACLAGAAAVPFLWILGLLLFFVLG